MSIIEYYIAQTLRMSLDLRSSPTVLSTLLLFALSNLGQAHHKET